MQPCFIEHFSINHIYDLLVTRLKGQQQTYSKYYALVLAISISLLAYALHSSPKSSFHNVLALLTDPYVARGGVK